MGATTMTEMGSSPFRIRFARLQLHPRSLFLPATLVLVFVLRFRFGLPLWGLASIMLLLPLHYFALPALARKRERAFERSLLEKLQRGRVKELLPLYKRQLLLRLYIPAARLQKHLGFIYSELGDFSRARACYQRAAADAAPGDRMAVLLGLARTRYRSGDFEGAEVVYRELIRRGQEMPEVFAGLAHCLLLQEVDLKEAFTLARKAAAQATTGAAAQSARLTLAEALALRGRVAKARKEHDSVEMPDEPSPWLEARSAWVAARIEIADDEPEEACDHLDRVIELDDRGPLGDFARELLDELEDDQPGDSD